MALLLHTDTDCSSNCLSPKHHTFVLSRAQTVSHPNTTLLSYLALKLSFAQTPHFCLISRSDCLSPKHHTFVLSRPQTVFRPNTHFCLISRSDCLSPKHPTFVLSRAQTVSHPNTTLLSYLALRLSLTQTPHFCLISHSDCLSPTPHFCLISRSDSVSPKHYTFCLISHSDFHANSTFCLICLLSKHHTLSLALTPMSAETGIQFVKFLCFSRRFQFQCVTQEEPVSV